LRVQRKWGLEIGECFGDQGDAVEALASKALEFKFGDHVLGPPHPGMGAARRMQGGSMSESSVMPFVELVARGFTGGAEARLKG